MCRPERILAYVAALAVSCAAVAEVCARDEWFTMSIDGIPCGWLHEQVAIVGSEIETTNEMRLMVGRAGAKASVAVKWQFKEGPQGTPLSCTVEQSSGSESSHATYRFKPDQIHVDEAAAGRSATRTIPVPARAWLTPGQVEEAVAVGRATGSDRIAYTTVDPAAGLALVDIVSTRTAKAGGATIHWTTHNSSVPVDTTEEVDGAGRVVRSSTTLAIGALVALRSTQREALAAAGLSGPGIDLIGRSVVQLASIQPALLGARSARFEVKSRDSSPLTLPSCGAQRVDATHEGGGIVTVDVSRASAATPQELADPRYLASTLLIDGDDPAVRALAGRALLAAGLTIDSPPRARAEALRAFVVGFIIHKDLATAFAGASAVAQSRSGDCSEHAILLAALLRADSIPSRVASGLVYADEFAGKKGVFAWHMWTQALIDGAWLDLDPTLRGRVFHPGHLLIATSAQDDAQLDSDFAGLLATIGNISIERVHVD